MACLFRRKLLLPTLKAEKFIKEKISLVVDLYDTEKYGSSGNYYRRGRELTPVSPQRAIKKYYRAGKAFQSDEERITFLFELYERYTAPLTADAERAATKASGKAKKPRSQKS